MNNENLIKAMRETMLRQSQVITALHQQIESLESKTRQSQVITSLRQHIEYLESKTSQDQLATNRKWMQLIEGAKDDGDTVIIFVKDGNNGARFVCHELLKEKDKLDQQTPTTTPTHSWGKITEVDGGFNGQPDLQDTMTVQEVWEAAGGNPGIKASKQDVLTQMRIMDKICDEVDEKEDRLKVVAMQHEPEKQEFAEIHQWRRIDRPKQSGWVDDSKERAYHSDPGRIEGRTVYVKKVDN